MIQSRKLTMQKFNFFTPLRCALTCAALLGVLMSCGKDESEIKAAVAETAPVVVVEEAPAESLNDIMKRLGIDQRIRIEDGDKAPNNIKQAEVILVFFNAMLNGDANKLSPLMSQADQLVLADMKKSGQFKSATKNITRINLGWTSGTEPGTQVVLAFFTVEDDFAAQLWSLSSGEDNKPLIFSALPSPPKITEKLEGNKTEVRIKQWLNRNKEELAIGKIPDEIIDIPQQDRSVKGEASTPASTEDASPKTKPGSPGRRTPTDAPVDKPE